MNPTSDILQSLPFELKNGVFDVAAVFDSALGQSPCLAFLDWPCCHPCRNLPTSTKSTTLEKRTCRHQNKDCKNIEKHIVNVLNEYIKHEILDAIFHFKGGVGF